MPTSTKSTTSISFLFQVASAQREGSQSQRARPPRRSRADSRQGNYHRLHQSTLRATADRAQGRAAPVVQMVVDGMAHAGGRLSKPQAHAITQMMKLLAGLDVQQRQRSQAGGLRAELAGTKYILQVLTTPLQTGGERLIVKIRNLALAPKSPDEVGFSRRAEGAHSRAGVGEARHLPDLRRTRFGGFHHNLWRPPQPGRLSVHGLHSGGHARLGAAQPDPSRAQRW